MRARPIVLLLVLANGCDRGDAASSRAQASGEAKAPAPTDAASPAPGTSPAADRGPVVLRMADGSGEPVHLGELRDFHALTRRLAGLSLVERASRFELRDPKALVAEIAAPISMPSRIAIELRSPAVATASGVTVGQSFAQVRALAPDLACMGEGSEDGTTVACTAGAHVTVEFRVSKEVLELPDPMTIEQAEAAVGKTKATAVRWESDEVPAPATTTAPSAPPRAGVLPAGLHWVGDGYSACDLGLSPEACVVPAAAVVAGRFEDEAAAGEALRALDVGTLAPGYPLVVHSGELHPREATDPGIFVVVALLAGDAEAESWAADHASLGTLGVVGLKRPREIASSPAGVNGERRAVVQLRPGARPPRGCTLAGGTFAVVDADSVDDDAYESVAVPCEGGSTAKLPWTSTLVDAVVVSTADGARMVQLVGAVCDSPIWRTWPLADGVPRGKGAVVKTGGC